MSEQSDSKPERLHELLADRALFGLSAEEEVELQDLLRANPDVDSDDLDRLAAAVDLTTSPTDLSPLPPDLAEQARSQARKTLPESFRELHQARFHKRELLAWLTAIACFLLAVFTWATRKANDPHPPADGNAVTVPGPEPKSADTPQPPPRSTVPPKAVHTLVQERDELLASREGVIHLRLGATEATEQDISGDIVWSPGQQRGYLRLKGLPSNDPTKSQYQLWLVEASPMRSETVNGGVFNVNQQARELIVPIRAEHFVKQPNMFVISIEPPGGSPDLTTAGYPLVAKLDNTP